MAKRLGSNAHVPHICIHGRARFLCWDCAICLLPAQLLNCQRQLPGSGTDQELERPAAEHVTNVTANRGWLYCLFFYYLKCTYGCSPILRTAGTSRCLPVASSPPGWHPWKNWRVAGSAPPSVAIISVREANRFNDGQYSHPACGNYANNCHNDCLGAWAVRFLESHSLLELVRLPKNRPLEECTEVRIWATSKHACAFRTRTNLAYNFAGKANKSAERNKRSRH